jgi:hypothetical protein
MENNNQQLTENAFADSGSFEMAQRMAIALSKSELIPKAYQGNIPSTMIALELSKRTGVSPIMVMQNLHVIQGRPSWSSSFIIAVINSYKKFSMPLNFLLKGEGDKRSCIAFTTGTDGQRYESPEVNIKMATDEGWMGKSGSKWKTMPDLMLRYRSAAFFGRLYCPELLMGMQSEDETIDIKHEVVVVDKAHERVVLMIQDATSIEQLDKLGEQIDMTPTQIDLFNQKREEVSVGRK